MVRVGLSAAKIIAGGGRFWFILGGRGTIWGETSGGLLAPVTFTILLPAPARRSSVKFLAGENLMNLIMVRHGQSYVNLLDWDKGNIDAGLTELGQQQAAALAEWLPAKITEVDAIYCSTMLRAQETAEPLSMAYGLPLICDDRLREIGNNKLDHTAWPSEDLPEYHDWWASERPFSSVARDREQGETLMHFRIRVGNFIEDLIDKYRQKTIITVCHGGVIEITHDHVFNVGPWRRCEVWTHNTGITRFELVEHPTRETWRLHYHSRIEHLREIA